MEDAGCHGTDTAVISVAVHTALQHPALCLSHETLTTLRHAI